MLDDSLIDLSAGPVSPQAALAELLLAQVDRLTAGVRQRRAGAERDRYLDALVGLCAGAEAFHAADRGDTTAGLDYLGLALERLRESRQI
jgi:hypothetical protein